MGLLRTTAILGVAVWFATVPAQVVRQTTNLLRTRTTDAAVDDAGTVAFAISDGDPYGTNPGHRFQIFKWNPATGAGAQVTSFANGVDRDANDFGPSVTDDGTKVAFLLDSRLALINADGTGLVQLTTTPAPINHVQIAGDGSRVVFDTTANLTGANPNGVVQVFAVEANGTGLRQLTSHSTHTYGVAWPTISDDGTRVAYLATQGTVDGKAQIAGILQDGTGFHYLTNSPNLFLYPGFLQISGNGQTVAFQATGTLTPPPGGCSGSTQIAIVEWTGTGLLSLDAPCIGNAAPGWAGAPDITDDAQVVFYPANEFGVDIYRINRNRTGKANVTNTAAQPGPIATCAGFARVAGGGSRVAFTCTGGEPWGGPNPDLSGELYAATGSGTGHRQLTNLLDGDSLDPDMTPDGAGVVFVSTAHPSGNPPYAVRQIYRAGFDGGGLVQVTSLSGWTADPSVTDTGDTIVFVHGGDPLGTNVNPDLEIFAVDGNGANLRQLTPDRLQTADSGSPRIAGNGSIVVLVSAKDLLGEGGVTGSPVYRVKPDGSGLARLSSKTAVAHYPRVDPTGTWVVYHAASQVHRQRVDGSVDQIVGTGVYEGRADVTPGGGGVVFESTSNPLGTNADGNLELFLWEAAGGTTRQLTVTTSGENRSPAFSRDGAWVYFWSDAPRSGGETPGAPGLYRLDVATAAVQRVGGLQGCTSPYDPSDPSLAPAAVSATGALAVFGTRGDCTDQNLDGSAELFTIDRLTAPKIQVSGGVAPTVVSWDVESGPTTYDVVRGDVASLATRGDGSVDLGAVACLENDSPDPSTANAPDAVTPLPGQVFFYLYRGNPGSYGTSSSGGARTPSSGNCQ